MKKLIVLILAVFSFLTIVKVTFAVDCSTDRCTTCDLCGYCQVNLTPQPTPGDWERCRNCLYPAIIDQPAAANETLKVDTETNIAPTPQSGSWYTMLGCISTGAGGFSGTGASGNVVQFLLRIIFSVAGGIAMLYVIYGAFILLTSQADPERLQYGKRVIIGAIVGLVITLSSVFIINIIGSGVLKIPGFGDTSIATPTPIP